MQGFEKHKAGRVSLQWNISLVLLPLLALIHFDQSVEEMSVCAAFLITCYFLHTCSSFNHVITN